MQHEKEQKRQNNSECNQHVCIYKSQTEDIIANFSNQTNYQVPTI